jgi:hypothetical protein
LGETLDRAAAEQGRRARLAECHDLGMKDIEIDGCSKPDRFVQAGAVVVIAVDARFAVAGGRGPRARFKTRMDDDGTGGGSSCAVN